MGPAHVQHVVSGFGTSTLAGTTIAVIPTVFLAGPLALLAILLPAAFGGLAVFFRRWIALFSVLTVNSTLYILHGWIFPAFCTHAWASFIALWWMMILVWVAGLLWSTYNHGLKSNLQPGRYEVILLASTAFVVAVAIAQCICQKNSLLAPQRWFLISAFVSITVASATALVRAVGCRAMPLEGSLLTGMLLAGIALPILPTFRESHVLVSWVFESAGTILSTPVVSDDKIYIAVTTDRDGDSHGVVYCLDRYTGNVRWLFDNEGKMKPAFSSPFVVDGRLYIGEGYHEDSSCRLYCIDSFTGRKVWDFPTHGHTESSPTVLGDRVYFGAGEDGIYCVDTLTGSRIWHFIGPHVDSKPAVAGGRVFAGSGYGDYEVFCLDAETGKPHWRIPIDLPSFGAPTVAGDKIFFGIGNGNLVLSSQNPAGAVLCLHCQTGEQIWRYRTSDAVHGQPILWGTNVYVVSRDSSCYCLDSTSGELQWRLVLRGPAVAAPVVLEQWRTGALYVMASSGSFCCVSAASGQRRWELDVDEHLGKHVLAVSSPAITTEYLYDERARIYIGVTSGGIRRTGLLCCFKQGFGN